jgi:hypothetical protein
MSADDVLQDLRTRLVVGAHRRRARERARLVVGAAVAILLAVLVGGVVLTGRTDDPTRIATLPADGITDTCNALLDLQDARRMIDPAAIDYPGLAARAARSGDGELAASGRLVRDATPGTEDPTVVAQALDRMVDRCRDLGAPGMVAIYVPARLGPAPNVALDGFGTEQPMLPSTDRPFARGGDPYGHDLSPIALARSEAGAYVMTWSYRTPNGQQFCLSYGTLGGTSGGGGSEACGPYDDEPLRSPINRPPINLVGGLSGRVVATVSDQVSFVVVEIDGRHLVQRPAEGYAVFATGDERGNEVVARAYGVDGAVLGCVASGTLSC